MLRIPSYWLALPTEICERQLWGDGPHTQAAVHDGNKSWTKKVGKRRIWKYFFRAISILPSLHSSHSSWPGPSLLLPLLLLVSPFHIMFSRLLCTQMMTYIHFSFYPERGESVGRRMVAFAMALVGVYPQYRSCRFVSLSLFCFHFHFFFSLSLFLFKLLIVWLGFTLSTGAAGLSPFHFFFFTFSFFTFTVLV